MNEFEKELERAESLFPPFNSAHEGIAVIREEYLELEKEVFWGDVKKMREEAIQLGAMAMRMVKFLDKIGD